MHRPGRTAGPSFGRAGDMPTGPARAARYSAGPGNQDATGTRAWTSPQSFAVQRTRERAAPWRNVTEDVLAQRKPLLLFLFLGLFLLR